MPLALAKSAPALSQLREILDIRDAAEYLGISPDTLYKYASDGFIPAFKLGNRWRFKRSLLDGWIDQQSAANQQGSASRSSRQKKPSGRAR